MAQAVAHFFCGSCGKRHDEQPFDRDTAAYMLHDAFDQDGCFS
jgi:hypothetical protein